MSRLVEVFSARVEDRSTLDELHLMIGDEEAWYGAHDLFDRIRGKTLVADQRDDVRLAAQYFFEEACAKTLFNLSGIDTPFDEDSPYWVVPAALGLARRLNIDESEIIRIVAES